MKKVKYALKILAVFPVILLLLSCNPIENESDSASILILKSMTGTDLEGNEVNYLQSDVLFVDPTTSVETITADEAKASLGVTLLDPVSAYGPSSFNGITVDRYVVTYMRADGKNVEGVDVPYSFEGALSAFIEVDSSVDISFVIVRAISKAEPPLIDLIDGRAEGVLNVNAKVDFYGHDLTNRNVKATGYISIFFTNYVNE